MIRTFAKGLLERVLVTTSASPRRMAGRALVLAYHNVVPEGEPARGDRSLHLPLRDFKRQLDLLEAHCSVRPLSDLLDGFRDASRPSIAITFDDAYRGAVRHALPELARRRLPATLFVAPGLLGQDSFWWDELAESATGLDPHRRRAALEQHQGIAERIRATMTEVYSTEAPPHNGCATEEEIRAACADGLLQLGAHSWSHPNLAALAADELDTELGRPLEWLRGTRQQWLPIIAYPYGRATSAVAEAARRRGYTAGLMVDGGWIPAGDASRWQLPRMNIPAGMTDRGLLLRLSAGYWR